MAIMFVILQIKSSFYSMLAALCQSNPELAREFADTICPVVLHNLDESDPLISPNLWEAVLYTITTIQVGCYTQGKSPAWKNIVWIMNIPRECF